MNSAEDDDVHVDGQNSESSSSSGAEPMDSASENFEDNRKTRSITTSTEKRKTRKTRSITISTENRKTRSLRSRLHTLMYQAAFEGDWQTAQIVLQMDPNVVREKITERGDTALHVAAIAKQTKFVKELVKKMAPNDLLIKNRFGYTAFIYAAGSGIVKIAAVMRKKRPDLVHCGENKKKPIYWAALLGHADMVSYLYKFTRPQDLSKDEWFALLLATTEKKMYDVALEILRSDTSLAIMIETAAAAAEEEEGGGGGGGEEEEEEEEGGGGGGGGGEGEGEGEEDDGGDGEEEDGGGGGGRDGDGEGEGEGGGGGGGGGGGALRLLAEHDISNMSTCEEAFLQSLVRMCAAIPRLSCKDHAYKYYSFLHAFERLN